MMLDHLGEQEAADRVRKAVNAVLREGKKLTRDLGGNGGHDRDRGGHRQPRLKASGPDPGTGKTTIFWGEGRSALADERDRDLATGPRLGEMRPSLPGSPTPPRWPSSPAAVAIWLLEPVLGTNVPLTFFVLAVAASAWIGGVGPGLFATVISLVAAYLLTVNPNTVSMSR